MKFVFKNISLEETTAIRGIAILMMIFLHCFNYHPQNEIADISIYNNNLSYWLTKTAGLCVPLYCFLSGYGLYTKYPYPYKYCFKKSFLLAKKYWFFLTIFVLIGVFGFDAYDINITNLCSNFLGYDTTFNPTLWFLLPYIIVFISSPLLLRFYKKERKKEFLTIIIMLIIYTLGTGILKLKSMQLIEIPIFFTIVCSCIFLVFYFFCGAFFSKHGIPTIKFKNINTVQSNCVILISFIALAIIRCFLDNQFFSPFFCIILLVLILSFKWPSSILSMLEVMGRHSLNMWFIHAYFTYKYLEFCVYWMKYPIFIFISVVLFSYVISIISNRLMKILKIG